jgi:hypothetical protein
LAWRKPSWLSPVRAKVRAKVRGPIKVRVEDKDRTKVKVKVKVKVEDLTRVTDINGGAMIRVIAATGHINADPGVAHILAMIQVLDAVLARDMDLVLATVQAQDMDQALATVQVPGAATPMIPALTDLRTINRGLARASRYRTG